MKPSLPASPSFHSHPKPVGDQQAGSSGIPDHSTGTFSGKGISIHPSPGDTATLTEEGQRIEDAFWKKKPLQGRQITSADVLTAYGNDQTSLRGGLFLQKLYFNNILHDNRRVTPDDVIQEFKRVPDQENVWESAIEHFEHKVERMRASHLARFDRNFL